MVKFLEAIYPAIQNSIRTRWRRQQYRRKNDATVIPCALYFTHYTRWNWSYICGKIGRPNLTTVLDVVQNIYILCIKFVCVCNKLVYYHEIVVMQSITITTQKRLGLRFLVRTDWKLGNWKMPLADQLSTEKCENSTTQWRIRAISCRKRACCFRVWREQTPLCFRLMRAYWSTPQYDKVNKLLITNSLVMLIFLSNAFSSCVFFS